MEARSSQSSRTGRRNRFASFYLCSRYAHGAALPDGGSHGPVSLPFRPKKMAVSFEWYHEPLSGNATNRELSEKTVLILISWRSSAIAIDQPD